MKQVAVAFDPKEDRGSGSAICCAAAGGTPTAAGVLHFSFEAAPPLQY